MRATENGNGCDPLSEYSSVKAYLRQVGRPASLSPHEERFLALRVKVGDADAREKIIRAHLRLAVWIAFRFQGRGLPIEDLIAEANIGLMKAVDRFDCHLGFRFSTYAAWWIRRSIREAIAEHGGTIRLPQSAILRWRRFYAARAQLRSLLDREPTPEEIADHTEQALGQVRCIVNLIQQPVSLDAPLGDNGRGTLAETLEDRASQKPGDAATKESLREALSEVLATLSPREREVLELRFGLADGTVHTLEEISARCGITYEAIRQREAKALRRLRHPSRQRLLREFVECIGHLAS